MTTKVCVDFIKMQIQKHYELCKYEIENNPSHEDYCEKRNNLFDELYEHFEEGFVDDDFKYNYWWNKLEGNARLNAINTVAKALYWDAPFNRSKIKPNHSTKRVKTVIRKK